MKTTQTIVHTIETNTGYGTTITTVYTAEARRRAIYRAFDNGSTIKEVAAFWGITNKEARQFRADYRSR